MPVAQYPTPPNPAHVGETNGPQYLKLLQLPDEYPGITVKQMADGGATYGAETTNVIHRWEITYGGLSAAMASSLDAHRASANDKLLGFTFRDPRTDYPYTDVHYDDGYQADHTKVWSQSRVVRLIKRPA
jgi:hypothetical protein